MSFNWFISVDDHLIEPAQLWQDRLPARWKDTGPRIVRDGSSEFWAYEDRQIVTTGLNAVAGKTREEFSPEPISYEDMRPGCYQPAARVADMNQGHVLSSLLFPSFPRYCGQVFNEAKDRELGLLCVQAWNNFILEELSDAYPGRFIPQMIIPLWDPVAAAAEVERTAARGAKAIAFSENPTVLGLPSVHTDHWERLWAMVNEAAIPVCMHIGSSSRLMTTSDDAPPTVLVSLLGVNSMMAGVDWLMSGILERYSNLKVILSEGGAGWIPYILERADKAFHDKRIKPNLSIGQTAKTGSVPPSQLFRDHMYVCLVDEHFALRSLRDIGVDNLLWEGDYPHGDGLWPHNHDYLTKVLAEVPDEDAAKIAETNLRKLLNV
jgi:predicted TIM-barrel fold metal-dependent hydrolase